ncbi:SpoIIE family protein phosphatase [Nonomuraea gerenzanensis]|uniref:protein-serine/threonine phosphatase n=1 Tax=Nonomuraea gerenzanensis TaxID=93944 RepID=A0A1M4EA25_9ACTN|nr:SpoIIE family protein phosphatase [Nonomuraea gerenzanensis]UBU17920.1 SpoIIE family protein phosphatase [Nonomuraea gerenzanensis]SBO95715.1 Serine phosphatase RsbU, regulator of sigma subunit [Nonomuraea gerenzanensis]
MGAVGQDGESGLAFETLDPAPVGVAVTRGPDHRLVYTNAMYRSQFSDPSGRVPLEEAFAGFVRRHYRRQFDHVYATGEPVVTAAEPEPSRKGRRGDRERYFTRSLSRVVFGPGDHGVLAVVTEVTEQTTTARRVTALAEERRRILRRYESLIRVSADIVWVTSRDGYVSEPSPSWERITGQPWEAYRGQGWLRTVHPDDRPATVRSWARAVGRATELWEHVYRLRTAAGGYRHFQLRAVPICEDGEVVEWVGSSIDVEQQWQEQRRQRLLDRAAIATAQLRSLEEMLGALADVIVPELGDGCGVYLVTDLIDQGDDSTPYVVERLATAARSGLVRLPPYSEERLPAGNAFATVVRHRRPLLKTFPTGSPPPDLVPRGTRPWLEANDANGVLLLPVVVDGTVPAVVCVVTCGSRPALRRADISLLNRMFENAHDALSRAIRFQRAQQIALALQYSLLAEPPQVPGMQIVARYRASPSAAEVGGDWYDSFVLPDGVPVLVIGDVAGHDLNAAVAMSQLRNMLRALAMDRREPPGEILTRLNVAMESLSGEVTATCVYARVEAHGAGHRLHYATAGHPPPLLVSADGRGHFLDEAVSPLLGVPHREGRLSRVRVLPPGSTLLLYTDGLVERPGEHLDQGLERLRRMAEPLAGQPVDKFCDQLLSGLPTTGLDDIAVIALRLPPQG